MQITISSKELDEVVLLWLKIQGVNTDNCSISLRPISGRSAGSLGNRIECTLEPISVTHPVDKVPSTEEFIHSNTVTLNENPWEASTEATKIPVKFGQGHADE